MRFSMQNSRMRHVIADVAISDSQDQVMQMGDVVFCPMRGNLACAEVGCTWNLRKLYGIPSRVEARCVHADTCHSIARDNAHCFSVSTDT